MPRRPCCSPATDAARGCSVLRTTMPAPWTRRSRTHPQVASSAPASSARWGAETSCTGSRPPWPSFRSALALQLEPDVRGAILAPHAPAVRELLHQEQAPPRLVAVGALVQGTLDVEPGSLVAHLEPDGGASDYRLDRDAVRLRMPDAVGHQLRDEQPHGSHQGLVEVARQLPQGLARGGGRGGAARQSQIESVIPALERGAPAHPTTSEGVAVRDCRSACPTACLHSPSPQTLSSGRFRSLPIVRGSPAFETRLSFGVRAHG